jgi:hypothetical protein
MAEPPPARPEVVEELRAGAKSVGVLAEVSSVGFSTGCANPDTMFDSSWRSGVESERVSGVSRPEMNSASSSGASRW